MLDDNHSFDVHWIPPTAADRLPALHLALEAPLPTGRHQADARVREFLADAEQRCLCLDLLFGVYAGPALLTAAVAVESPGRAALVFLPYDPPAKVPKLALTVCLSKLQAEAWSRSNLLLQMLLPPGASTLGDAALATGFRHLTRLFYMRRAGAAPSPIYAAPSLEWITYSSKTHRIFAEAISQSYTQSMDCPELTGLRGLDDVIAGHKAAGAFNPQLWSIALRSGEPVGVLLLGPFAGQPAMEIVYMGVMQVSRGTGVANALMARAITLSSANDVTLPRDLALAVDERNAPARRLYVRWGFVTVGVREAWIATSPLTRT